MHGSCHRADDELRLRSEGADIKTIFGGWKLRFSPSIARFFALLQVVAVATSAQDVARAYLYCCPKETLEHWLLVHSIHESIPGNMRSFI